MATSSEQYLRVCHLSVFGKGALAPGGTGIDFSDFHIKFSVKRSCGMSPNMADIRVYNVAPDTISRIGPGQEFYNVVLQAGYQGNYGVIFTGNIKQIIAGRESATDTFIDLVCGDGDLAYNFSVVNTTIGGNGVGATQAQQLTAAATPMAANGVTPGFMGTTPSAQLPRGKVMFGSSKDYMRQIADTTNQVWSIQDSKLTFIPVTSYLPGEVVVLNSKNGMIGTPQQTNVGINVKCLLNPSIKVGGRYQLNNASVALFKIDLANPNSAANIPAPIGQDGIYFVTILEYAGDNRGTDWYCNITSLTTIPTGGSTNAIPVNYG